MRTGHVKSFYDVLHEPPLFAPNTFWEVILSITEAGQYHQRWRMQIWWQLDCARNLHRPDSTYTKRWCAGWKRSTSKKVPAFSVGGLQSTHLYESTRTHHEWNSSGIGMAIFPPTLLRAWWFTETRKCMLRRLVHDPSSLESCLSQQDWPQKQAQACMCVIEEADADAGKGFDEGRLTTKLFSTISRLQAFALLGTNAMDHQVCYDSSAHRVSVSLPVER